MEVLYILWGLSCYIRVFVVFVIKPINMRMGLVYSGNFRNLNRFWSVYSTSCLWRTYFCDDNSGNSSKSDKRRKSLTFERIHGKNVSKIRNEDFYSRTKYRGFAILFTLTTLGALVGVGVGVFVAIFIMMFFSKNNTPKVFLMMRRKC